MENHLQPTGLALAAPEELYCWCNGPDDGLPMIQCANGVFCPKEWYHMECVGVVPPGPCVSKLFKDDSW